MIISNVALVLALVAAPLATLATDAGKSGPLYRHDSRPGRKTVYRLQHVR